MPKRQAPTTALAWLIGCAESTIRMWASRGFITPQGTDHRGRNLYDVDQALRIAERFGYRTPHK